VTETLRFLTDEDFDNDILRGFLRRLPQLDIVRIQDADLSGEPDPVVLEWAEQENRIVLTHDVKSMPPHAYDRLQAGLPVAGVCVISQSLPIGQAIDAGATEVTVIFMDPKATPSIQSLDNLAQVGLACLGIMQQKILELDMKTALRVNAAVQANAGGTGSGGPRRTVALREYRPSKPLDLTVLQFDRQDLLSASYNAGFADGRAA